jgi:hypothetical protein
LLFVGAATRRPLDNKPQPSYNPSNKKTITVYRRNQLQQAINNANKEIAANQDTARKQTTAKTV